MPVDMGDLAYQVLLMVVSLALGAAASGIRNAKKEREDSKREMQISIHAPRVGSDRNIFYYSEPKTISCELRSQHDQLSGHLRTEYTRLFSQNRCEPATFP